MIEIWRAPRVTPIMATTIGNQSTRTASTSTIIIYFFVLNCRNEDSAILSRRIQQLNSVECCIAVILLHHLRESRSKLNLPRTANQQANYEQKWSCPIILTRDYLIGATRGFHGSTLFCDFTFRRKCQFRNQILLPPANVVQHLRRTSTTFDGTKHSVYYLLRQRSMDYHLPPFWMSQAWFTQIILHSILFVGVSAAHNEVQGQGLGLKGWTMNTS